MKNIFTKSNVSNYEYRLLLLSFLVHPIYLSTKLFIYIYIKYIYPPKINFGIYILDHVSWIEFLFNLTSLFAIVFSFFLIFTKRLKASAITLFIPLSLFCFLFIERIINLLNEKITFEQIAEIQQTQIFFPFDFIQFYLFGFILLLFLWQTKILNQEKINSNKLP